MPIRGAGHYFFVLVYLHLVLTIFPFPVSAKRGEFVAPIIRFSRIFRIRRASPISGVRIAASIVLAQHKENKRIGEARTPVRRASPIVIELAY